MTSFNFAHGPQSRAFRFLLEVRVPERFYAAVSATCIAIALLSGSWGIEAYRLAQSIRMQAAYQDRFDESARELKEANVYRARVRELVSLDRRVRAIASSGYGDARRLAEIAGAVPDHAWLTAVSYDDDTIRLDGQARDWGVLASAIRRLAQARHLKAPVLLNAAVVSDASAKSSVRYALRLDGTDER